MALIRCNRCGNMISEHASTCPKCRNLINSVTPPPAQGYYQVNQMPMQMLNQPYYDVVPQPSFGNAVGLFFSNFFDFSGRARRSELWYPFMFVNMILIILGILTVATNTMALLYVSTFFQLFCFFPMVSVSVRRLHDRGYVGFLAWLYFIPYLAYLVLNFLNLGGVAEFNSDLNLILTIISAVLAVLSIVLLVIFCHDGIREPNKFGRSTKYVPR